MMKLISKKTIRTIKKQAAQKKKKTQKKEMKTIKDPMKWIKQMMKATVMVGVKILLPMMMEIIKKMIKLKPLSKLRS